MIDQDTTDHPAWPLRALLLAGLGAVAGILFHQLARGAEEWAGSSARWALAGAIFLAVSGVVFALSLERVRWGWSTVFAGAAGLVAAFVGWSNGASDDWSGGGEWQFAAALAAIAFAVPLFQSARDQGRARFAPAAAHNHVWTDVILGAVSGAFAGMALLLTLLLSELFALIGVVALRDMLREGWFAWMVAGGAFGGAVGLLRDRGVVLDLLQRLVRTILSVLAPALALGLVLFVLALPFTGLEPLWEKTRSATPILLACVFGAVALVTAVAGNREDEERARPLRWAAVGLIAVMLPLALVAAVSTGKRIGQYGFTPDRLWAMVFVVVAAAFGVAYLVALIRGRAAWSEPLRRANVRVAAGVSVLALFLALPIVSFGAISAKDQAARLEQGRVSPDRFDWRALRFDFGPAGVRALERLARGGPLALRQRAADALAVDSRLALQAPEVEAPSSPPRLAALPGGASVPRPLYEAIARTGACAEVECRLVPDGPARAVLLSRACEDCQTDARIFDARSDGSWTEAASRAIAEPVRTPAAAGGPSGRVEVRTIEKRQVYIDGKPVGPVYGQPSS